MNHSPRHQHLRGALMMEIAIGETHARDRSTEAGVVFLVEIEARLERNALDRSAHRLAADLQRIAGEPQMTNRAGAAELHRTCRAHIIENPARATGAVEARKGEHLAGDEPAGLFGIHLPGQRGRYHPTGRNGPQHETRKHAVTPTSPSTGELCFLYPLLTIPTMATLEQVGW